MKIKFTLTRKQFRTLFSMMTRLDTTLISNADVALMTQYILSGTIKRLFNRLDQTKDQVVIQWRLDEAAAFRLALQPNYDFFDSYEQSIVDYMLLTIGMRLSIK
ncbi:MAG: hypothetical protein PHR53_01790 [Bacteroidales bacterium]|nr:hypothetical protein [Bacteroidales bacterium]